MLESGVRRQWKNIFYLHDYHELGILRSEKEFFLQPMRPSTQPHKNHDQHNHLSGQKNRFLEFLLTQEDKTGSTVHTPSQFKYFLEIIPFGMNISNTGDWTG
jgi:hypothetical protein